MPFYKSKIIFSTILSFGIISLVVLCCKTERSSEALANTAEISTQNNTVLSLPSVKNRLEVINQTLQAALPVIVLNISEKEPTDAQNIFINEAQLSQFYKTPNNEKMLNEIFTIRKALPSDVANIPNSGNCYRVEMYNYAKNTTIVGVVDYMQKKVINISVLENSAPDVPEHLKKIAVDIAINSELVKKELGDVPEIKDAQMAYTKTALNNSKCERSLHLCVAPTFTKGEKALWTIIDLTDLKLVGTRWTFVGDPGPVRITERKIQNEKISSCYCEKETDLNRNNWEMKYMLTSSDGLRVANVKYKGKVILKSAKLVDWHVSYSNSDGFGYSDGVGCPTFSLSAVTAWDIPKIMDLKENDNVIGFVIEQTYKSEGWPSACNYNYVQRFEFYNDGKFRTSTASIGRGCGNDGTYRPVLRIAFDGKNNFAEYDGTNYSEWKNEKWTLQKENTSYSKEGYAYKIFGTNNFYVEPNRGQFRDNSRGDNAYVYVTNFKQEEGENDLVTIGPCCNIDYKQGPEKFIEPSPETINNEIVLWYVPQMKNDDRKGNEYCWAEAKIVNGKYETISYPCFVGPMFVPIK